MITGKAIRQSLLMIAWLLWKIMLKVVIIDNSAISRGLLNTVLTDGGYEVVGDANVSRNGPVTMASEDFSYMLRDVPGAYIQIGNGDGEGACEVHNPGYDFNDGALPYGASLFVRLVEKRLDRLGG